MTKDLLAEHLRETAKQMGLLGSRLISRSDTIDNFVDTLDKAMVSGSGIKAIGQQLVKLGEKMEADESAPVDELG